MLDTTAMLAEVTLFAKQAGVIAREMFNRQLDTIHKSSDVDLLTEADIQIEAYLTTQLQTRYPTISIMGEEGATYEGDSGYRWVIDPIDGTTNFAHHIPHFAISIALADDTFYPPVLGVVYDPMRDECFYAARGQGAFLNGKRLHVSATPTLAQSVMASGFPYTKWTDPDTNATQWGHFVVRSRGVRRMGSAALDMCYVGAGRFDGYWEHNISAWDMMGGAIVLTEAGGQLSNYQGEPLDNTQWRKLRIVASNGNIHDEILTVLREGDHAPRPINQQTH